MTGIRNGTARSRPAYPDAEELAEGPNPASTHCGRARSETWSCDRNDAWQNDRACEPQ